MARASGRLRPPHGAMIVLRQPRGRQPLVCPRGGKRQQITAPFAKAGSAALRARTCGPASPAPRSLAESAYAVSNKSEPCPEHERAVCVRNARSTLYPSSKLASE